MFENFVYENGNSLEQNQNNLMQGLARYFVGTYNSETAKYASTLLKEGIVDLKLISREDMIAWFDRC